MRGRFPSYLNPTARAITGKNDVGSRISAREMKVTPSTKWDPTSWAAWRAREVLPTPPGPVSVSRRTSGWRRSSFSLANSCWRPMRDLSDSGKDRVIHLNLAAYRLLDNKSLASHTISYYLKGGQLPHSRSFISLRLTGFQRIGEIGISLAEKFMLAELVLPVTSMPTTEACVRTTKGKRI